MQGDALAILLFLLASGVGAMIGAITAPPGWRANLLWVLVAGFVIAAVAFTSHPSFATEDVWKLVIAVMPLVCVLLTLGLQRRSPTEASIMQNITSAFSEAAKATPLNEVKEAKFSAERPPINPAQMKDRVFVSEQMSRLDLCAPFQNYTKVQAHRIVEIYLGKWTRADGLLHNLSKLDENTYVATLGYYDDQNIICPTGDWYLEFSSDWTARLEIIPLGHSINVVGQIYRIEKYSVWLQNCEIVEPIPTLPGLPSPSSEPPSS